MNTNEQFATFRGQEIVLRLSAIASAAAGPHARSGQFWKSLEGYSKRCRPEKHLLISVIRKIGAQKVRFANPRKVSQALATGVLRGLRTPGT